MEVSAGLPPSDAVRLGQQLDAISRGPWEVDDVWYRKFQRPGVRSGNRLSLGMSGQRKTRPADLHFICFAREKLPIMLEEIAVLRQRARSPNDENSSVGLIFKDDDIAEMKQAFRGISLWPWHLGEVKLYSERLHKAVISYADEPVLILAEGIRFHDLDFLCDLPLVYEAVFDTMRSLRAGQAGQ